MRNLDGLDPEWISPPGRFGLALTFLCPTHRNHRLFVWLRDPLDGQPPLENEGEVRLYFRELEKTGLGNVTILEYLDFGDCYSGMLLDGVLMRD